MCVRVCMYEIQSYMCAGDKNNNNNNNSSNNSNNLRTENKISDCHPLTSPALSPALTGSSCGQACKMLQTNNTVSASQVRMNHLTHF